MSAAVERCWALATADSSPVEELVLAVVERWRESGMPTTADNTIVVASEPVEHKLGLAARKLGPGPHIHSGTGSKLGNNTEAGKRALERADALRRAPGRADGQ